MKHKAIHTAFVAMVCFGVLMLSPSAANSADIDELRSVSGRFVSLMVQGQYDEMISFGASDPKFAKVMSDDRWSKSILSIREAVRNMAPNGLDGYELADQHQYGSRIVKLSYILTAGDTLFVWTLNYYKEGTGWVLFRYHFDAGEAAINRLVGS